MGTDIIQLSTILHTHGTPAGPMAGSRGEKGGKTEREKWEREGKRVERKNEERKKEKGPD